VPFSSPTSAVSGTSPRFMTKGPLDLWLTVWVDPYPVPLGKPVRVTVRVQDRITGQPVAGEVLVDDNPADQLAPHAIGRINAPVSYTFKPTTM
jgi:hypothetical protein